ncbi:hypothetical protein AI27_12655 [Sphingomonas sp. BHC-A]|nr:hypothetical protein AI27_12655 [Sphingomonas sp. BHC-A]
MTHADHLRILRLPRQLEAVRARLAQLQTQPRHQRNSVWLRSRAAAEAKHRRLTARAAALGLRDLAALELPA